MMVDSQLRISLIIRNYGVLYNTQEQRLACLSPCCFMLLHIWLDIQTYTICVYVYVYMSTKYKKCKKKPPKKWFNICKLFFGMEFHPYDGERYSFFLYFFFLFKVKEEKVYRKFLKKTETQEKKRKKRNELTNDDNLMWFSFYFFSRVKNK